MSLTVAQMRTRVARVVGMSETVAADTALIDAWFNDAVEQFLVSTKINIRPAVLALTAGEGDYTLDTDILAMQSMWFAPAISQSAMMVAKAPEDIYRMRITPTTDGPPVYYALLGAHSLLIHPAPVSATDSIHMLYVPRPTAMSTTAHSPSATAFGNIPAEYHVVLENYVKWKAGEAEEHRPSENGLQFQAAWERDITKVKVDLRRKAGTLIPDVLIGRQRRPIVGPGVDLR